MQVFPILLLLLFLRREIRQRSLRKNKGSSWARTSKNFFTGKGQKPEEEEEAQEPEQERQWERERERREREHNQPNEEDEDLPKKLFSFFFSLLEINFFKYYYFL